ncbi:MAG: N-acetyltransferase family protein [Halobacteriaceae archaeon]
MTAARTVGPFDTPPRTFEDAEGREITLRAVRDDAADREALVRMYEDFDPGERAQGLPPVGAESVRAWLADLLAAEGGVNVAAFHGDRLVGHATLVPGGETGHELAIFVHQAYQGAGIGTRLLEALLGAGAAAGVEAVWLTVERWNRAAVNLYEKIGFERTGTERFAVEMRATLARPA